MNDSRYIDENDLPFTEDELFRALAVTEDERSARQAARTLAELLSNGTYEGGWSLGDEVFAALASLSDELRERVDTLMRSRWEATRLQEIRAALLREGRSSASEVTASARLAADEEVARQVADWQRGRAALEEWVRGREAGQPVGDAPPPWPGLDDNDG